MNSTVLLIVILLLLLGALAVAIGLQMAQDTARREVEELNRQLRGARRCYYCGRLLPPR